MAKTERGRLIERVGERKEWDREKDKERERETSQAIILSESVKFHNGEFINLLNICK